MPILSELRPLAALAMPYRGLLAASVAAMLLESAAALAVPWTAGLLAAAILLDDAAPPLAFALLGMLALFAAQALARFANAYFMETAADRISGDLRVRLYEHLQALPVAFYERRRLGEALALLTNDVYEVSGFIGGTAVMFMPLLLTAIGAVVLMFGIRADLALAVALAVPLFFLALKVVGRRMRPLSRSLQDAEAEAIAIAQENLGLLPAIKVFTREPHEAARYRSQIDRILALSARQRRLYAGVGPLLQFLAAAAIVSVVALASTGGFGPRLPPPDLVAFLLYALLLTRPVAGLADVYGRTQVVRGALSRLRGAMDEPAEPFAGRAMPPLGGAISLRGIRFAYEGRTQALDGLDLDIAAGETVAIVGPNGAGKSTLAHLILRLHDPQEGEIRIDGIDVATVSLQSLRGQIGVVPQHVMLFNASVRDNIAYGRPDCADEAVAAAARIAGAHEFILRLPQGYETPIGDRGVRLSGGEQQRLALARALLKNPRILILDEATSMFDAQGERDFLASCRDAFAGRTVILITHRASSLAAARRVVHLEAGRIVAAQAAAC